MSDLKEMLERADRAVSVVPLPSGGLEELRRRRDHRGRNRRIAAGVVGMAVFAAAVWIVRDVASFKPVHTPAVQPTETPVGAIGAVPTTDYLLDLDTGETTPLPQKIASGQNDYAASPDGSRLAYTHEAGDGTSQIFVANVDGSGIERLTYDVDQAFSPAWSPDGSRIAYIGWHAGAATGGDRHGEDLRDLFVLDLATRQVTQLTFATRERDPAAPSMGPWRAWTPSFTPDGSSIVYGVDREEVDDVDRSDAEIRMVPVNGGESVRLTDGIYDAALSPDGSRLLRECTVEKHPTPSVTRVTTGICLSNLDGTDAHVIVHQDDADVEVFGNWSSDGSRISYSEFHSSDVFVMDVATGTVSHVADGWSPVWVDDHTLLIETGACYNAGTGGRWGGGCAG
jgi:Tol biopolymer transport system component